MHVPAQLIVRLLAWAIALVWCAKLAETLHGLPRVPDLLTPDHDRAPANSPLLAVIVPARNEAAGIHACLASLLAQDYPNLRILAVDDRSTDATGAVMDELAALHPDRPGAPTLEVLHIAGLPPNWLGKTHAMALAARRAIAAGADFLLFTDADVIFSPTILRRSLAFAEQTGAAHLVTFPTTLTHTPGESMLLACLHVLGLFPVRPWQIPNPRARDAVGVGAFNLVTTSAYLQTGGFDAIPLEIVEDLTLGRRIKAAGLPARVAYAPGAVTIHWAPGLLGVLHGLTKNTFAAFHFNALLLAIATLGLAILWVGPYALLVVSATRVPGLLAVAAIIGMYAAVSRRSLLSPVWAAAAPVAAALLMYSMLRSMVITLVSGGVTWRGTFYPLRELRQAATATAPDS